MDGWTNRILIDEFVAFAKFCMKEYNDLGKYWITFNEINVLLMMGKSLSDYPKQDIFNELHNQLVTSARVVEMAHKILSDYLVGSMNTGILNYPLTCDPNDVIGTQKYIQDNFGIQVMSKLDDIIHHMLNVFGKKIM